MEALGESQLRRLRAGDIEAFGQMVATFEHSVLNLAHRLTGDLHEALDVRQAAFLNAFQGLKTFNGDARLGTWLFRIVVNLCRDRMRARKAREAALRSLRLALPGPRAAAPPDLAEEQRETAAVVGAPPSTVKSRAARALDLLRVKLKDLAD